MVIDLVRIFVLVNSYLSLGFVIVNIAFRLTYVYRMISYRYTFVYLHKKRNVKLYLRIVFARGEKR